MPSVEPRSGSPAAAPPPGRERVLTLPLTLFLLAVAAAIGAGTWQRLRLPDLEGAILELADGDLDGEERQRMLRHVVELARGATSVRASWAGVLAAISLEDRAAHAELARQVGGEVPTTVPPPAARTMLDLGEPVLGYLLAATAAECAGVRDDALRWWGEVLAASRLEGRGLARDLAERALARLRA